jgi:hypothetical protein
VLLKLWRFEGCQEDDPGRQDLASSGLVGLQQESVDLFESLCASEFGHLLVQKHNLDRLNVCLRVLISLQNFADALCEQLCKFLPVECDLGSLINVQSLKTLPDHLNIRWVIFRKKDVNSCLLWLGRLRLGFV